MTQLLLRSHPASRLLAGCCLLAVAVFNESLWLSLFFLLFSAILINLLDAGWHNIIRLLRLLRWFVVPIFLLHALLSPGQLVLPGTALPWTREGTFQGLWLGIHFSTVFVAAILLFKLLFRSEWLQGMLSIPLLGRHLHVYLLLVAAMKKNIGEQLGHMRQQWRLRPDWRSAAVFVLASFRMALAAGREQAWMLWLRWPGQKQGAYPEVPTAEGRAKPGALATVAWVLFGIATLLLARQ